MINLLNQGTATNYFPGELFSGQAVKVDETQFYTTASTRRPSSPSRGWCATRAS